MEQASTKTLQNHRSPHEREPEKGNETADLIWSGTRDGGHIPNDHRDAPTQGRPASLEIRPPGGQGRRQNTQGEVDLFWVARALGFFFS